MTDLDATRLTEVPRTGDGRVDLDALVGAAGRSTAVLLESAPGQPHAGRWSYVVPSGGPRLVDDGVRTVCSQPRRSDEPLVVDADPFEAMDRLCAELELGPDSATTTTGLPPFVGGLVLALSYDLGRRVERLPSRALDDRGHPHLEGRVADRLLAVDHEAEEVLLIHRRVARAGVGSEEDPDLVRRVAAAPPLAPPPRPRLDRLVDTTLPGEQYRKAVLAALEHIGAGDAFQVNVTQRLTAPWAGDVFELYRALRRESPAAFGACVPATWGGIASISPELFLQANGRKVLTRPIKGTRPRDEQRTVDGRLAAALAASPKDRAENVMVVDMERNDLGRVCQLGSVKVEGLLELEGHPTVWHLVSSVTGTLRADVGYGELLRATFPSGSVTGTPKVRAMEIIDELEPVRRSFYCGGIGFLTAGALSMSVAIRTAVVGRDATADYGSGGGVVADSDPNEEHAESLAKALPFLRAIGAADRGSGSAGRLVRVE